MKLQFDLDNIDSVEVEGDHIYVYFTGALAVCFHKKFFETWYHDIEKFKLEIEEHCYNSETFDLYVKRFLKYKVAKQERYS